MSAEPRYFARDWLAPEPTPGQMRVRELAQAARDTRELSRWVRADRSLLDDEVTGQRAGASDALRAYAAAQSLRRPGDESPRVSGVEVRAVIPGGWDHDEPLAGFIRPELSMSTTLHAMFHEGVYAEGGQPHGQLFVAEQLFYAGGGSHRTMAHVLAGVLLPPALGDLSIVDGPPDPDALTRLRELEGKGIDLHPEWASDPAERQRLYDQWRERIMRA